MNKYPEGALIVKQAGEGQWSFEYPRLSWDTLEEFHEAIELWRAGHMAVAEAEYRRLTADFPEFIDAHHHLALLLSRIERPEEAYRLWGQTVAMGLDCLPEEFEMGQDLLPWIILENRPFLRAFHALGLAYLERGRIGDALEIFENILAMNPGDNQGVRALVVDCHFRQGHPERVLETCGRYPGDGMEQLMYGRALALYQLRRQVEADEALAEAVQWLPLVARELAKKRHPRPWGLDPARITVGGADQAYYYWEDQGQHWKNTPGAITWVRESLQKQEGR